MQQFQAGRKSYYEVLGVARDCTEAEIRSAYKAQLLLHHPDKKGAGTQINLIQEAYKVLVNKDARSKYNQDLDKFVQTQGLLVNGDGLDIHNLAEFDMSQDEFFRECPRCNSEKGMVLTEADLEDGSVDEEGNCEVIVQCGDCSLWIRVQYEIENED